MSTVYDFEARSGQGETIKLEVFKGKTLLIVNTASKCGFTGQYEGLEALYKKYRERGFEILGFPCNQFGNQEPGTDVEIREFCQINYGVSFPLFEKVEVNGENALPLFSWLCRELPGLMGLKAIKWNFTKFLIDKQGRPFRRLAPKDGADVVEQVLEEIL